ncbi:MAG TPA: YIP1 family protein [Gallionellaceae bacterium]
MAQLHLSRLPQYVGWNAFTHSHMSVLKMLLLYALPLSLVPPVMIGYAGIEYGGHLLPALEMTQLAFIGVVFLAVELAMTFLVAYIIKQLGVMAEIKPAFEDAYKLAVVVPTPLWLAPLFLFIPSFILNLSVAAAAMILSAMLIYYGVPAILKVEEKGHAVLLSGSILSVGMVAWAAMMYLTLLTWSFVGSSLLLLL